jgi:hypothetical protein
VAGSGRLARSSVRPGRDVDGEVPGVALNEMLERNLADTVGIILGFRDRSGDGGPGEGQGNSDGKVLDFGKMTELNLNV